MKSSLFNVFVSTKNGYALYNTLSESVLFCDEELKCALESNSLGGLTGEHVTALKKAGVILDRNEDELFTYQYRYDCKAFDTVKTQCIAVTTYRCNLACPYCYEGKGEAYSGEMDIDTAEKVMKAMQNRILQSQSRYFSLILFGGEPLLNLDIGLYITEKMGEWCLNHAVQNRTFMVTNGTMLTREIADLIKGQIDCLQITLDGPQPFHDKTRIYRNGKGTYSEVISALETALEKGIDVSLRVQINRDNCYHMDRLFSDIEPLLKTGRIRVNIAPLSKYSGMCSTFSSHFLKKEEQETVLPKLLEYTPNTRPTPNYVPCVACTNNWIFDGNGNVYKCITTLGEKRVGYIGETGVVWESELYDFMARSPLKIPACRICAYLPQCGGGCPREAFLTHSTYENSVCGGSRKVYSEVIKMYLSRKYPERF